MNGCLLDTNVLSELTKPEPDKGVVEFLANLENGYISVLTIHEFTYGIELQKGNSKRKKQLSKAVDELVSNFQDKILPIGQIESAVAGKIRAKAQTSGRTIHVIDSLIAATASARGLSVVTRNEKDFQDLGIDVVNPWAK